MANYSSIFPVSSGAANIAGFEWSEKTADFTAEANKAYYCDTALGDILLTLPSNPAPGDEVAFLIIGSGKVNITTTDNVKGAALATDFVKQTGQQYLLFVLFYVDSTTGWNWDARYNNYIIDKFIGTGDPFASSTILLLNGDGANNSTSIVDSSAIPKAITRAGDTKISTSQSKYGGSSIYLDGTGDYLDVALGEDSFNIRTSVYTAECWYYHVGGAPTHFSAGDNFYVQRLGNVWYIGDSIVNPIAYIEDLPSYSWNHYALSFDLSIYRFFINGILKASSNTLLKNHVVTTLTIGARAGSFYSNGYYDAIRVTKLCRYTTSFDPENVF